MGPDRGLFDDELTGDLAVRESPRDQLEDIALARGELAELGLMGEGGSGLLGPCARSSRLASSIHRSFTPLRAAYGLAVSVWCETNLWG